MKSRQIQIQNKMFIQNSRTKYGKYFIPKWLYITIFSPECYAVIPDVLPLKILFILVKKSILFDINRSR